MRKIHRKKVDGVLLLNKLESVSSNKALQQVRSVFSAKKAGHTGTLDPFADGLLVVCFGEANKYARWMLDANKSYRFIAKLGERTSTGDTEGEIIESAEIPNISECQLNKMIDLFTGCIKQTPSAYSAIKINGKRAYQLAREGQAVKMPEREVVIHSLNLKVDNQLMIGEVMVSKGTYIRTLVEDLAANLGTVAHCKNLKRTSIANFSLSKAFSLTQLQQMNESELQQTLYYPDLLCQQFPVLRITQKQFKTLAYGQICELENVSFIDDKRKEVNLFRLYLNDTFIGLGQVKNTKLAGFRLMSTNS